MNHWISNLDASWKSVRDNSAGLSFKNRDQRSGHFRVFIVHLYGRGQLPAQTFGHRLHLIRISRAYNNADRAKYFFRQFRV